MRQKKGYTLVEILVALAVMSGGLIGLLAVIGTLVNIVDNIQDRTMSRIIAQNYIVAIQQFVSQKGYDSFRHGESVGMATLDRRNELYAGIAENNYAMNNHKNITGAVKIIEVGPSSPSSIENFQPDLKLQDTLFPELENSGGEYWVRILFHTWRCSSSPLFEMKVIKISIGRYNRLMEEKYYDFWYCITNYINYRSPLHSSLCGSGTE